MAESFFTIDQLNDRFSASERDQHNVRLEMRNNARLYAGQHYKKHADAILRFRQGGSTSKPDKKIRLTENHLAKVVDHHVNLGYSRLSSIIPSPKNLDEPADQKSAELNASIWQDIRDRQKLKMQRRRWTKDFFLHGEAVSVTQWDAMAGKLLGMKPGQPSGAPTEVELDQADGVDVSVGIPDDEPVYTGDTVNQHIPPYDRLTNPGATAPENVTEEIILRLMAKDDLIAKVGDNPRAVKAIEDAADKEKATRIFNPISTSFEERDNLVLVRAHYFKPSAIRPKGQFYIVTNAGILFKGTFPLGGVKDWPVIVAGHTEIAGSARHYGIIRNLRPGQKEINRVISTMAMSQLTFGPKIFHQKGSSLTPGFDSGGHKRVAYTGAQPFVSKGETGAEYLPVLERTVQDFYFRANMENVSESKPQNPDQYAELLKSMKDKSRFIQDVEPLEDFERQLCQTNLELARVYFPDQMVVPAIGSNEVVNLDEFRETSDLNYDIRYEAKDPSAEDRIGRMLEYEKTIQYLGSQLSPATIGAMIEHAPFQNFKGLSSDITLDNRVAKNMVLALDRGQDVSIGAHDPPEFMLKTLGSRMREPSFRILDQQIQQNYQTVFQQYEELMAQRAQEERDLQNEFIPAEGALLKTDLITQREGRNARTPFPAASLRWLAERLAKQQVLQEDLERADVPLGPLDGDVLQQIHAQVAEPGALQQPTQAPPSA